jgi:flagellar biosynthesis chaperone FliJ
MSSKRLASLCAMEDKKLARLGDQKKELHQRVETTVYQCQHLSKMIDEYRICDNRGSNALLWQNASNMAQVLVPMTAKLVQKQALLQQEKHRLDYLWRRQLGRQQSIKWYQTQQNNDLLQREAAKEQKSCDDLAGAYGLLKR